LILRDHCFWLDFYKFFTFNSRLSDIQSKLSLFARVIALDANFSVVTFNKILFDNQYPWILYSNFNVFVCCPQRLTAIIIKFTIDNWTISLIFFFKILQRKYHFRWITVIDLNFILLLTFYLSCAVYWSLFDDPWTVFYCLQCIRALGANFEFVTFLNIPTNDDSLFVGRKLYWTIFS